MISIALNGCGRIGKNFIRALFTSPAKEHIALSVINVGPADPQELVYLLRYDSLLGTWDIPLSYTNSTLYIDDHEITIIAVTDYDSLRWDSLRCDSLRWKNLHWPTIDWVIDATGAATQRSIAEKHLAAGARNVLITAPSADADITIVPGVNESSYVAKKHHLVSLGSCTTNATAPLLQVIDQAYGIESATLTTIHAYTNSQALLDVNPQAKDPRSSRAATLNIIPHTTGASQAVGTVLPHLAERISGISLRVPTPVVSLADIACTLTKTPSDVREIHAHFTHAAQGNLAGILAVNHEPLVSSDFAGNSHSVIYDSTLTTLQGGQVRLYGWYDNEWAYSCRLRDFLVKQA